MRILSCGSDDLQWRDSCFAHRRPSKAQWRNKACTRLHTLCTRVKRFNLHWFKLKKRRQWRTLIKRLKQPSFLCTIPAHTRRKHWEFYVLYGDLFIFRRMEKPSVVSSFCPASQRRFKRMYNSAASCRYCVSSVKTWAGGDAPKQVITRHNSLLCSGPTTTHNLLFLTFTSVVRLS